MKKFLLSVITLVAFSGFASAQTTFAGPSFSGISLPTNSGFSVTLLSLGGQVGVYNLAGPLGVRATVDATISPISGLFLLSGDLLFASGGDTNIYGGAGFGIIAGGGATAPLAKGFVGVEFPASEGLGIFVELDPHFAIQTGNFFIGARAGVNFLIGGY